MRFWTYLAAALACLPFGTVAAQDATVDVESAQAVVDAVLNPDLEMDEALAVAALPGNQGLIRKAISYGRPADEELFARALVAAATGDESYDDPSVFNFVRVRNNADAITTAIDELTDPEANLVEGVQARLKSFTPEGIEGDVTGYMVAGGTSGGFAFGEPIFYLNLDRFPSASFATTIMQHEMYHAVQPLARNRNTGLEAAQACMAGIEHGEDIDDFYGALRDEGTASYVGNILALPETGTDDITTRERARFQRNVNNVGRSVTQLELSVHGLTTGADTSLQDVYALGFYGDEVLYALGYVMARSIAEEDGPQAIAGLIGQPGSSFILAYSQLDGYGESEDMPVLKTSAVDWAERLDACRAQ